MKHVYKVPFLFRRIATPPESDLYELAAGRVMNIMRMFEFHETEIVLNSGQRNINDYLVSINSEVEVLVSDLYDQTAEPLEIFVLTSAIMGVIEACIHFNTPLNLKSGIASQIAKLMRSYKTCNC
jgi:hypothetical protein